MAQGVPIDDNMKTFALRMHRIYGGAIAAAKAGVLYEGEPVGASKLERWIQKAKKDGIEEKPEFEIGELPSELPPTDEILERRRKEFARKDKFKKSRKLIDVKVNLDGPIGILHFGDPHVDDPGTDIVTLERHLKLVSDTDGLMGANVGDLHNNWVGRLSHLYGQQSTSAQEAWALVEWMVSSIDWLYLIGGNHDCWSGAGDPLKWMTRTQPGASESWGARLNLKFPNKREIRVNARHDFHGHSQWNPNHGPAKAIKMGWRDHILTCGHKHTTGMGPPDKCPATGLISWPIRVAGYKVHDRYADELGLPDQNISPACLTIIDPSKADNDPNCIVPFLAIEQGVEYLKWLRK